MFQDIIYNLSSCTTPECLAWHVAMGAGALVLGLWMAYEIWSRPWKQTESLAAVEPAPKENILQRLGTLGHERPTAHHRKTVPDDHVPEGFGAMMLSQGTRETAEAESIIRIDPETVEPPHPAEFDEDVSEAQESAQTPAQEDVLGAKTYQREVPKRRDDDLFTAAMAALGVSSASGQEDVEEQAAEERQPEEEEVQAQSATITPRHAEKAEYSSAWQPPESSRADDLTLIRWISLDTQEKLGEIGVSRYAQIAHWDDQDIEGIAGQLGIGFSIEEQNWLRQADELNRLQQAISKRTPYKTPPEPRIDRLAYAGDDIRDHAKLGMLFRSKPEVADDLERIRGLDRELRHALNRLGVFRFKQIGDWGEAIVNEFALRLNTTVERIEDERWVPRARLLHLDTYRASNIWSSPKPALEEYQALLGQYPDSEDVKADARFGVIYSSDPAREDDLSRIDGIGDVVSAWLRFGGIFRYQQIADWSEANISALADQLDVQVERIYSEGWIPQARALLPRMATSA